jgi:hypothetical protein
LEFVEKRYGTMEIIVGKTKDMKEGQVSKRGADLASQVLAGEVELRDSIWSRGTAVHTMPMAEVDAHLKSLILLLNENCWTSP